MTAKSLEEIDQIDRKFVSGANEKKNPCKKQELILYESQPCDGWPNVAPHDWAP
ncbi:hypothetical protein [Aurantiacibacter suaedae]|uniref:hypothetical protein n=1 Tax=Aurantiacibacter suaedae TaxID=2545755 RepID=UPI001F4F6621|nr:hypothetical protein [Aurantiacibacter suaedae]